MNGIPLARRRPELWLVPLGVVVSGWLLATRPVPLLYPDSQSYIQWEIARSAGYPLFLRAVALFDPTYRAVGIVQLAILASAATLLSGRIRSSLGSPLLGLAVGASTLVNIPLLRFGLSVLSEAIFASLLMLHLVAVLAVLRGPSRGGLFAVGLTAGAAVLVRPAGLSLLAGVLLVAYVIPRPKGLALRWLITPIAALWLAAAAGNLIRSGVFALQEFGGISLSGHVAPLIDTGIPSSHSELVAAIAEELRPWREEAARQSWPTDYYMFTTSEYNPMSHVIVRHLNAWVESQRGAGPVPQVPTYAVTNRVAMEIATATIRKYPLRYLAHVSAHVFGIWTLPQWRSGEAIEDLRRQLRTDDASETVQGYGARLWEFVSPRSGPFLAMKALVLCSFLGATLIGLVVPIRRGLADVRMATWLFCSLNLHAGLGLVCATQAASWRYSIVWWPYGALALALALAWAHDLLETPAPPSRTA